MRADVSYVQERLWFLQRYDPADSSSNLFISERLRGQLDADALERALAALVSRHETLRTRYPARDGEPVAVPGPIPPLDRLDLTSHPEGERERRAADAVAERTRTPFDVAEGPILRAALIRLGERDHVLHLAVHHIAADGWSIGLLTSELASIYTEFVTGVPADLPPPRDHAWHAADERARAVDVAALAYWREQLNGAPVLNLPTDRPRRDGGSSSSSAGTVVLRLPAELGRGITELATSRRCTAFMALLAAYHLLLARQTGQDDVCVGSAVSTRDRPELEEVVGPLINTVVLRGDLTGDLSFAELLTRTRSAVLGALSRRDVPFSRVAEEVAPGRDGGRNPLLRAQFGLHHENTVRPALPSLTAEPFTVDTAHAQADLSLEVHPSEDGLAARFVYDAGLFDHDTVARVAARFEALLGQVVAHPDTPLSRLDLLAPGERAAILARADGPKTSHPDVTLADLLGGKPGAVAAICGDERITYAELDARSRALARRLRAAGAGRGTLVAICARRSIDLLAGLLAVVRAGAAYLPLDPGHPAERLAYVLADSGAQLLLTQRGLSTRLPGDLPALHLDELCGEEPEEEPGEPAAASDLAYVIYTSGSTGRPKGVAISHGALANLLLSFRDQLEAGPDDVWLASTSLSFDISALELYLPLITGGTVVIADDEGTRDGSRLAALAAATGVTHLQATPSGWRMLLDAGFHRPGVVALTGGEALPGPLATELRPRVARLWNVYGPTETTIWSSCWEVPAGVTGGVRIGRAIANTRLYVLDRRLEPVPDGSTGELFIAGDGLARGYPGRPGLTAERFLPDPYGPPGTRMYRTGDLARWRGGEVECLGRTDEQVKLRGHRIEPGEVEARLMEHPSVARAAVVVRGDRLVAYVVPASAPSPPDSSGAPSTPDRSGLSFAPDGCGEAVPQALAAHARAMLPASMVPAAFVPVPALPLTPNGKVDRAALPDPDVVRGARPPATPAERLVAEVFAEVLGLDAVGADDGFFDLGGHSLLASRAGARLTCALGTEVAVRALFDHPTVAALAAELDKGNGTAAGPEDDARVLPRPPGTPPPLSAAQERLWFLQRFNPDDGSANMYLVRRLRGPLDRAALARAVAGARARHESLRTSFPEADGVPIAVVHPSARPEWEDLGARDEDEARRLVAARVNAPFDLAAAPPHRLTLIRLADDDHVLCWVIHHILGDGWSLNVLMDDLVGLYAGRRLTEPVLQHGDVAAWQRGRDLSAPLAYWRRRLADTPVLDLPTDRPRTSAGVRRGGRVRARLPEETVVGLERLAREHDATLFMVLLTAYQVLLARHCGQDDVVVGTVTAGRDRVELEPVFGNLTHTVALRADLRGDPPFCDLLAAARRTVTDDLTSREVPYELLVDEFGIGRDLGRTPLFQTMMILHSQDTGPHAPGTRFGGLEAELFEDGHAQAKLDLALDVWREPGGLSLVLTYDADLFDATTVERLAERFHPLCQGIVADPGHRMSSLPLLTPADDAELRALAAGPAPVLAAGPVPALIARSAARTPDAVALRCGGDLLSYRQLVTRADALAATLHRSGVGRGHVVGVALPRGMDAVVALLGVLRAGAAYLPLDPADPAPRRERLLADSGAAAVLTPDDLRNLSGQALAQPEPHPRDAAYVIYTSGSTGVPKGVVVEHAALAARIRWMAAVYELGPGDVVVQFASFGFDAHVEEVYPTLVSGATLLLLPDGGAALPDLLASPEGRDVTVLDLPTAYWHHLVDVVDEVDWPPSLRLVILGGEQADAAAVSRWKRRFPGVRLVNTYGPTEATVIATSADLVDDGLRPAIGRPVGETTVWLLGESGEPVPPGAPGELCVGGAGVARGYAGRPATTAAAFTPDPFTPGGGRLYRTGDRARWRRDGTLEFLGRLDSQVKVRGYRIEPGEVEACLLAHPDVGQAAVAARGDLLVAYVVGRATAEELRRHAEERLPAHLVPGAWTLLDRLPLTGNGKVDRAALPDPEPARERSFVAPRTDAEALVAEVWADLLGVAAVGAYDDFFHLGGHSLLAVRIAARLRAVIGVEVPIRTLFTRRTVAEFAGAVEALLLDSLAGLSDEEALRLLDQKDEEQ
ncbi:non-ribosomal peptide synthetase [Nonomuraea ceibae]|uniref:non-ribosomal peptide synthetase n=1 Tax=Nonomuraea ceibae TaxID=1935170 RepID=UPI001C60595A|nr:non-ribosomal peptide synthetase [Nonomuraea ceibae]